MFFEKPLCTTMDEVDRIVNACEANGVGVVYGLDRAWWPPYVHLARLLADGLIGEVQAVFGCSGWRSCSTTAAIGWT